MLAQHKEAEVGFNERIQKMQDEKKVLQERITGLQRAIAQLDAEKRETERSAVRLEKDRTALKKTLDKVRISPWIFNWMFGNIYCAYTPGRTRQIENRRGSYAIIGKSRTTGSLNQRLRV